MFTCGPAPASLEPRSILGWTEEQFREIEQAFGRLGKRQSYQPQWVNATTQPALGNGTLVGCFVELGHALFVSIQLDVGSTTTFGTGGWTFSVPRRCARGTPFHMGSALFSDATGTQHIGNGVLRHTSNFIEMHAIGGVVTNTVPFTWATGDQLCMSLLFPTA